MSKAGPTLLLIVASVFTPTAAFAQKSTPGGRSAPPVVIKPSKAPDPVPAQASQNAAGAALALGQRVRETQKTAAVIPVLVLVSDGNSFIEAVGAWRPDLRFPVLIDDGSVLAAENIARFVYAFKPKDVVRFVGAKPASGWGADRAGVEKALAKAWGAESTDLEAMKKAWAGAKHEPPGIVVANEGDGAWPAAAALAAARGQPLLWITDQQAPRDLHKWWSGDEAAALDKYLQDECAKMGLSWSDLGDTLDAVTICASLPNIIEIAPKEARAMTDRIGRLRADSPNRWAWCGQIFGNPAEAAYRAMCPLFLDNDKAWLFDSYPKSTPWNTYSLAIAKAALSKSFTAELAESPGANIGAWRERVARPIDAGLFFVNTKGNSDYFELESGYGYCGDIPMLRRPAAIHIVHSWSMQGPGSRDSIGGRWLERGVYLYYGSVNEPTLVAFKPCPEVAELIAGGAVFSGAARRETGPAWKLTLAGDPLATLIPGAVGPRGDAKLELAGLKSEGAEASELIRKGDFAGAIRSLVLSGKEETAVKLGAALLKERPTSVTPAVARALIPALMRAGRTQDVVAAFGLAKIKAEDKSNDTAFLRDCLWSANANALRSKISPPDVSTLEMLRDNIRPEQIDQDLIDLGGAWAQVFDFAAASGMVESITAQTTDPYQKKKAMKAVEEMKRRRR